MLTFCQTQRERNHYVALYFMFPHEIACHFPILLPPTTRWMSNVEGRLTSAWDSEKTKNCVRSTSTIFFIYCDTYRSRIERFEINNDLTSTKLKTNAKVSPKQHKQIVFESIRKTARNLFFKILQNIKFRAVEENRDNQFYVETYVI